MVRSIKDSLFFMAFPPFLQPARRGFPTAALRASQENKVHSHEIKFVAASCEEDLAMASYGLPEKADRTLFFAPRTNSVPVHAIDENTLFPVSEIGRER